MTTTTFNHTSEGAKGYFELKSEGKTIARMAYSRIDANNIIVDHTEVDPASKGTGAGKTIVMEMVNWARANDQKVLPLCTFAKAIIAKHPETHDIQRK